MAHSLDQILDHLEQGPATFGWGAVLSFGRDELNRLIKEQYVHGFDGFSFLLPFFETLPINDDNTEQLELRGLVLGAPTLSFESASLNKASLTVTLNIINGTVTRFRQGVGVPPTVLSALSITQDMGFNVSLQASVQEIEGAVDKHGIVAVDLAFAETVVCNLSTVQKEREQIGRYFQGYFAGQANERRRFVLGRLELNHYHPLNPTRFVIRVQRAPGAEDPQGSNFGDGSVVVFVLLKVQNQEIVPGVPGEGSNFAYLVPDDRRDGAALYSASLVINHDLLGFIEEEQIDLLKNLVFPNQNLFVEEDRFEPHDMAIFGNLRPSSASVSITPSTVTLTAGQSQPFTLRRGDGSPINDVQWKVVSPDFPTSVGGISSSGATAVYTANAQNVMRRHRLPLVVTATYNEQGQEKVASALVQERFHSMDVAPLVHLQNGSLQTPTVINASTLGSGPLEFRILEPTLGARLEAVDANHQHYFPPPAVQPEDIVVQNIQVRDLGSGDQVQASIVLVNKAPYLEISPHYATGLMPGDKVQLQVVTEDVLPEDIEWSVIGEGEIEDGEFTAALASDSMISVVVARLTVPSPITIFGYCIINLQPVQTQYVPPHWENLQSFKLVALDGERAYANGFQQIPILIEIQTTALPGGGEVPVSDVELSRLEFVNKVGDNVVPFIDVLQEGIDESSGWAYAAHVRDNRFSLYSATGVRTSRSPTPTPKDDLTRYRKLWLHVAAEGSFTFYAKFKSDDGRTWDSLKVSGITEGGQVTVSGIKAPTVIRDNYQLVRDRAATGDGWDGPPDIPSYPNPFDYWLDTVDYWRLSYRRLNTYPVNFMTLTIESNISTIQWESEFLEETFFSYTGYAFYPARSFGNVPKPPSGLSFDIYFRGMVTEVADVGMIDTELVDIKRPSPGELIVSLHRVANMPYWYDGKAGSNPNKQFRKKLDPGVYFVLLDEEGNRHRLLIGFDAPTNEDSRNRLVFNPQ
jgi:hypothetical protein